MGKVRVTIRVSPLTGGPSQECEVLADTGATLTFVPARVLTDLGISSEGEETFELADGREIRRRTGMAMIGVDGKTVPAVVVFAEPGDSPLLGLTVLEQARLAVDPTSRRLIPGKFILYVIRRGGRRVARPRARRTALA